MKGTPHEWSWACLWAGSVDVNFEFVLHVCYDSEDALLEYGNNPRPQILHVKKKARQTAQIHLHQEKLCSRCVLALGRVAQIQVDRGYLLGIDAHAALRA